MDLMKGYPEEFAKSFAPSINFLYKSNIRFFNFDESALRKYWRFSYILPSVALLYVTSFVYICEVVLQKQILQLTFLLPPILVSTQSILKAIVLISNTSKLTQIIKELGALWRTTGLTEIQNKQKISTLKKVNICNIAHYWISVFGSAQYLFSPVLETLVRRLILKEECELMLPISAAYPLSATDNWITYFCIYIFQCYTMFIFVFVYVGGELIMITLCALLGIEFTLLREDLFRLKPVANKKRSVTGLGEPNTEYTISDFVKRHQKLIELSRKLDDVFNPMIFVDLFFVGITTCFFRYAGQFSRGPTYMLNNYTAVFTSLLPVLYLCYYGELLTGASAGIGDTAYETLWYKAGTDYQKAIWLIIRRSQKPSCLTSLRYAPITLNMFTKVMSTTWSYFSLMNTVYGDE